MFSSMRRHSLRLQHELHRWSVAGGAGGAGGCEHHLSRLPVSCMSRSKSCISSAGESNSNDSWSSSDSVYSNNSSEDSAGYTEGCSSPFRVVLLGASGVGKTLFASIFAGAAGLDTDDYEPYGDAVCEKTIQVDGESATISLFDTWDPEDESQWVQEECMQSGDAYLLLYSITDRDSFLRASELRISLRHHRPAQHTPIILVGNKCDLVRRRQVSFNEGRACAAVFDCKFIETSAAMEHNVWEALQGIVRQLRLRRDSKAANARRRHTYSSARRDSLPMRAKRFLDKVMAKNNTSMAFRLKSKSCHDLSVL